MLLTQDHEACISDYVLAKLLQCLIATYWAGNLRECTGIHGTGDHLLGITLRSVISMSLVFCSWSFGTGTRQVEYIEDNCTVIWSYPSIAGQRPSPVIDWIKAAQKCPRLWLHCQWSSKAWFAPHKDPLIVHPWLKFSRFWSSVFHLHFNNPAVLINTIFTVFTTICLTVGCSRPST
jgi:hypothetical protein